MNLTPGISYIVIFTTVDSDLNMTSREEYLEITDVTARTGDQPTYYVKLGSRIDINRMRRIRQFRWRICSCLPLFSEETG